MSSQTQNTETIKEYKYTRNGKDIIIRRKYTNKLPDKNRYSGEFDKIKDLLLAPKTFAKKRAIYNQHYRPISTTCFYRHFKQWLSNREPTSLNDNKNN